MIKINQEVVSAESLQGQYPPNSLEGKIHALLSDSNKVYAYVSVNELQFEVGLRKHLVLEASNLYHSQFSFRVFRKSKCNPDFWHRTEEGGFQLKHGVSASDGIRDIYIHSNEYGTECATAIVIVLYKALLSSYPETLFNRLFSEIYLMNWQHLDNDLGVHTYHDVQDSLPGDCRYFKNPDVNPLTPEWQGENVYDLGDGTYYGHGIGIGNSDRIIHELNRHRFSGSDTPAYLLDTATRPNFRSLYAKLNSFS